MNYIANGHAKGHAARRGGPKPIRRVASVPMDGQVKADDPEPCDGSNMVNDLILSTEPALDPAAYHGLVGEFLDFAEPQTEATAPCILAHFLPAVGTTIGPEPYAWGGDEQPARFNTAVVGPTADGRKGTGLVPVKSLMRLAAPDLWKGWPVKGLSSGEGLIARVADKVVKDDKGKEKLVPVEKRLYVVEVEFSKVLANTRREGNVLSQVMREAYDSGDLSTLTVIPREAYGAHISITGHITPQELRRRLTEVEMVNGFGNRFLWFAVKSGKSLPNAEPLSGKELGKFADQLKKVLSTYRTLAARGNPRMPMDADAKAAWEVLYANLCRDRPGFVGALTARGSSHVLRLSLLYAMLDRGREIKTPHLNAAMAVWRYSVASVELLFPKKTGDSLADRLYRLLGGGPMETKDFYRHLSSKGEDVREALERMEQNGLVKQSKRTHTGPGRPAIVWERA